MLILTTGMEKSIFFTLLDAMQKGRCLAVTGHTELCPVCEKPMCPTCGSHCVDQISRVTGYMQVVSGWNSAKKQEYEDRYRYTIPGAEMQ